ncbi:hypothetical protein [Corynebacterium bovis]|uniref:hypothetical protein n=1 Tax=Corynebacterium bovis TaxID=36808 RepID=UPI0031390CE4
MSLLIYPVSVVMTFWHRILTGVLGVSDATAGGAADETAGGPPDGSPGGAAGARQVRRRARGSGKV